MSQRKFFIVTPKSGLCNQLIAINKAIILGHIYQRDVCFIGFQLEYNNEKNRVSFDKIINTKRLQEIIFEIGLDVFIWEKLPFSIEEQDIFKLKLKDNKHIAYETNLMEILESDDIKEKDCVFIDNPVNVILPESYKKFLDQLDIHIPFHPKIIEISSHIKKTLNLNDYFCIHMRLEDDAIKYMVEKTGLSFDEVNKNHIHQYIIKIIRMSLFQDKKIYVCTGLSLMNNINNNFYNELKKNYNIVDKEDFIKEIDSKLFQNIPNKREFYAIIDLIIARDSTNFIGCDWSSFTYYVLLKHLEEKKYSYALKLYQTCLEISKQNNELI